MPTKDKLAAAVEIDPRHLCREADRVAARLARRFRLVDADREDLRQDLIVDLLARLRHFDPGRGTPDAFIAVLYSGIVRLVSPLALLKTGD